MTHEPIILPFSKANPSNVDELGAKGAKLAEDMRNLQEAFPNMWDRIAVPDGFILTTKVWSLFHKADSHLTNDLFDLVLKELGQLERRTERQFGDSSGRIPLMVAVRGGAPISLPGALGTVLNIGLNDEIVAALISAGEDESFVLTTFLTAIRMYGEIVLGIPYDRFYETLKRFRAGGEGSLSIPLLRELIEVFKGILADAPQCGFPSKFESNPIQQLRNAIEAVMESWMSPTAVEARRSRQPKVPDSMGTAVIVQEMVFGNRDDQNCLSGVLFTRNQRTGANSPVIDWAPKVQCEKIVSGKLRKPMLHASDLQERFPDIFEYLMMVGGHFESLSRRPLDMEFTVENRKLYLLQRRPLRMTSNATVRTMWDFIDEGKTNIQLASLIINKALEQPEKVLRDNLVDYQILAKGEPITDSADSGILVFGTEAALELANTGEEVILLRRRPYGENDVAVNHPQVRGIIRCDGNTTGHEAVSAVAYSKPYLINTVGTDAKPVLLSRDDQLMLNPDSIVAQYLGKRVFVDGERGILGYTETPNFLEDRKSRKKLYVDWEYLRHQFDAAGYQECDYDTLLDLHYQWELELEGYQNLQKRLREGHQDISHKELLLAFHTYLRYIPKKDRERTLRLKEVRVEDFHFGASLSYRGKNLAQEVLKIVRALMLCTTWCTHWLHEIMVQKARERGEAENDVIRDIFLKNRTMSMMREFEEEGFHVMKVPNYYHLVLASNFEYGQDLDTVQIGPERLNYEEKEILAQNFMQYMEQVNPTVYQSIRLVKGEPPLGQGHARIISIGLSIPHIYFDLVCRYLKSFLDRAKQGDKDNFLEKIPVSEFIELYNLDPFFAAYPELRISQEFVGSETTGDCLLTLGRCSYGEFDGTVYGKDEYEALSAEVKLFEDFVKKRATSLNVRPWQFEVDPYRRHSVIAAVGIRFGNGNLAEIVDQLKQFLRETSDSMVKSS